MIPRTLDVYVFVIGVLLTSAGLKLISLLPERYYFTFSQIVDAKNQSQFLTRPELPSTVAFCRSLLDEKTAERINPPANVSSACESLRLNDSVTALTIPSNTSVDGVALHSVEYKENMQSLIDAIKGNYTVLRDGIVSAGRLYAKPIEGLDNEKLESILLRHGTANLANIAVYAMDAGEEETDIAEQIAQPLSSDPTISGLLEHHSVLEESDNKRLTDDEAVSKAAKKYLAAIRSGPTKTIASFLKKEDRFLFWPALILKIMPAFATGMIMAAFYREKALDQVPLAAAFTAFLFCWPVIVLWDNVVSEEWIDYRPSFFALYIAYVLTFFFAARLGAMLMLRIPAMKVPDNVLYQIEWSKVLATALTTLITSGITAAITWTFAMPG